MLEKNFNEMSKKLKGNSDYSASNETPDPKNRTRDSIDFQKQIKIKSLNDLEYRRVINQRNRQMNKSDDKSSSYIYLYILFYKFHSNSKTTFIIL